MGTEDMTNYRPISLLPIMSKIIEVEVNDSLQKYCTENDIIPHIS